MSPTPTDHNRALLRRLMKAHSLSPDDVAALTRSSRHAVTSWLRPKSQKAHRTIPDGLLELLCLKLGEPSPFDD